MKLTIQKYDKIIGSMFSKNGYNYEITDMIEADSEYVILTQNTTTKAIYGVHLSREPDRKIDNFESVDLAGMWAYLIQTDDKNSQYCTASYIKDKNNLFRILADLIENVK